MMRPTKYVAAFAAASLAVAPAMAAQINPAASLSLGGTARASSHAKHKDGLFGAGLIVALVAAAAVVVGVVVVANDNSSSN